MEKNTDKEFLEKLHKEYNDKLAKLRAEGDAHSFAEEENIKYNSIDVTFKTTYYLHGQRHCARREVTDHANNSCWQSIMFEAPNGVFYKVMDTQVKKEGKIGKLYLISALYEGRYQEKKLYNTDFDILSDEERNLIMYVEDCYELMEECRYADL